VRRLGDDVRTGLARAVEESIDRLAAESNGRYRVAKLNTDDNPRTAARFQIEALPTMLIFRSGREVNRLVGLQPSGAISAALASVA